MKKPNVKKFINGIKNGVQEYSPQIWLGIGIGGAITSTVLAVKATPKALVLIEEEKRVKEIEELTPVETIKVAWKPYIPAALTGAASIVCLIMSNRTSTRRTTALAAAYKISETALSEYKEAVVETIGEKKEKAVNHKVNENRLKDTDINEKTIIVTGSGDSLFIEPITHQPFTSSFEKIKKVENNINHLMICNMDGFVSMNELLDELGLEQMGDVGDTIGWNLNRDGQLDIDIDACKTKDNKPALMLDYYPEPRYGYDKY